MEHLVRVYNESDRQTLEWLRRTVGDAAIEDAAAKCDTHSKPYLSAVCRALGLKAPQFPRRHSRPSSAVAEESLTAIKRILAARAISVGTSVVHRRVDPVLP
ncbi:hypothetical protein QCE64_36790 [Caballeronia sp. LZ043]|nr:hypothetical protein [Caballeronia sp. LZ043]